MTNTKQEIVEDRGAWRAAVHGVAKSPLDLVTEQQPTTLVGWGGFPSQATQGPWSAPFFPRLHPLSFPLYKLPLEPTGLPLLPLPQGSCGGSHLGEALRLVSFLSSSLRSETWRKPRRQCLLGGGAGEGPVGGLSAVRAQARGCGPVGVKPAGLWGVRWV